MILYFADRHLNILGQASTSLPSGIIVTDDIKTEDVETGIAVFECDIHFDRSTRNKVEEWAQNGNYILRSNGSENEFYTITDSELNSKKQKIYIYAEDDGLDLINEVVGAYEATEYHPISFYIEKYASGAGWQIGINEVEGLTRKLSWDSEETTSARLLHIAEAFNNCELSYSFKIKGLQVVKKYINIYAERGKDTGLQLRLNKEIDSITTTKSISNLATALQCTGGTPDDAEDAITLLGYDFDDGDFYVDGSVLKSRKALEKWSRYLWKNDEAQQAGGHIVKQYSDNSLSQAILCENAIAELKKICDIEVNYEVEIKEPLENVEVGDRVNIIDDDGNLYLSSRILILETSIADQTQSATLGEHIIKKSGISSKVTKLAADFAKQTVSVKNAKKLATTAKNAAEAAQIKADAAVKEAATAQSAANKAETAANTAAESAANAQAEAKAAQAAVDKVENSVASLETTIENAQTAADNAQIAADTATAKAEEAATAANNAQAKAEQAETAANNAQTAAESAISKADTAKTTAETAKATAESASATALAAKTDAEQAEKDIEAYAESLETYKQTVSAEYSRKTELTEAKTSLQAQISTNANELNVIHSQITTIDETANNAAELAATAQTTAAAAQQQANQATADAATAQAIANSATAAANAAQNEADTAKAAAATAQSVADKAKTDLEAAQADLATVQGRVDATEAEIAAAEKAVADAQSAADKAQADAEAAVTKATTAQNKADKAVTDAEAAQTAANNAVSKAELAQQAAEEAKGNAASAQAIADQATQKAEEAQATANTAKTNADNAQATADAAAATANAAQQAADDADAIAIQTAADLATAQQNLAAVVSRVDATEEEVAAAQAAVDTAQAAADQAAQAAADAQSTADTAKANAATAQQAADNAKTAADNAQAAAEEAQAAADQAQAEVNALTVRMTTAETDIIKNSELIALTATKDEVAQTLGGYYTKTETDAAIQVKSDEVSSTVTRKITELEIGGRNLIPISKIEPGRNVSTTQEFEIRDCWATVFISADNLASILEADTEYTVRYELELIEKTTVPTAFDMRAGFLIYKEGAWIDIGTYAFLESAEVGEKVTVKHIFTTPSVWDGEQLVCYSRRWTTEGAEPIGFDAFKVTNFKIERGINATDWTPAAEDITDATEAVAEDAEDALKRLAAAETSIQQLADSISMLVQDGEKSSKMVFDEESATWSFNTGEIDETLAQNTDDIEDLKNNTNEKIGDIQDKLSNWEEHISITTYEDEPCLVLYENDSNYKQYITNTRRIITETVNGTETVKSIVYLNSATYENVIAKEKAQIGGFAWKKRGTTRICLVWEGDE